MGNGLSFSETPRHVMESHLLKEVRLQTLPSLDTYMPYYKNGDDIDRVAAELVARQMANPTGPAASEEAENLMSRFLLAQEILRQKGESVLQEEIDAKRDTLPPVVAPVEPVRRETAGAFDPDALTPPYVMAWPSHWPQPLP